MIRPAEATFFEATVIKPEAVGLPVQNFELVALPVTEDKQVFRKRGQAQESR